MDNLVRMYLHSYFCTWLCEIKKSGYFFGGGAEVDTVNPSG